MLSYQDNMVVLEKRASAVPRLTIVLHTLFSNLLSFLELFPVSKSSNCK